MNDVYDINLDVSKLLEEISSLASNNQLLSHDIDSIEHISGEIKNNWTNDADHFSDVEQSLVKIEECINKYNSVIEPVLTKFVDTMNTLAIAHKNTSSKTVE